MRRRLKYSIRCDGLRRRAEHARNGGGEVKEEFKPPNGFKTKTRGGETLFCKKDTSTSTRFSTEKCYSEAQLREHMEILENEMRNLEQMRTYCSDPSRCQSE